MERTGQGLQTVVNRRRFLTATGSAVVGAVFLSACGGGDEKADGQSVKNYETEHPIPSFTPIPASGVPEGNDIDVRQLVERDSEGLPMRATFPSGETYVFDREFARVTRDKALRSGEVEIMTTVEFNDKTSKSLPSISEHPRLVDLPKDVMTDAQLASNGVEIIQPDNTHLYIRKGAFEKDGPLWAFNKTGRKLKIVLINAPVVNSNFLTDSRYDSVRSILKDNAGQDLETIKEESIKRAQASVERMRQNIKDATQKGEDLINLNFNMFISKLNLYEAEKIKTIQDTLRSTYIEGVGLYMAPGAPGQLNTTGIPDTAAVFLAVGAPIRKTEKLIVTFDPDGKSNWFVSNKQAGSNDARPRPEHSYPNPDDFKVSPYYDPKDSKSYPYGPITAGQDLVHELSHDLLIAMRARPDKSEQIPDQMAMDYISRAWNRWINSGKKDDSGYNFVFQLPQAFGEGYILTSSKPVPSTTG